MAVLTHVLAYFTWIIGPLVVLIASKDSFAQNNARTALNWQISLTIYTVISFVLMLVLVGFVLIFVLALLDIVFTVLAAVRAADGEAWPYPMAIPFLKQQ